MSSAVDERVTDEVEALEAILMEDVVIKWKGDVPCSIETVVHPSTGDDTDQRFVCLTLEVTLTPGYPDCSPTVSLRNPRGLDDVVLNTIHTQINEKLNHCLGNPVVFELIELIRENLTESNLPSGQCVICLYGFAERDAYIKTPCYHYFHSRCLASHFIAGKKYYKEEMDKLPAWQQAEAPAYQQTCPVCRAEVACNVETLKKAPPALDSISAPPFCLTEELKDLQIKMAALLAVQVAKGGVVGTGDCGPPPLTITTAADLENEAANRARAAQAKAAPVANVAPKTTSNGASNGAQNGASNGAQNGAANGQSSSESPVSPRQKHYRGPYRGFNRRGKPGRRGAR